MKENPFKFGTIVDSQFFTDRKKELQYIKNIMESHNHLVLISPRRFGKTSLVKKAVGELKRPNLYLNLQSVTSVENLAAHLIKGVFKLYPLEKLKHMMSHFRVIPTFSSNPMMDGVDVSFQPFIDTHVLLEDAFWLLEKVGSESRRLVVVLDEFQECMDLEKGIDKRLRAIMQEQKNINYILLGSQESMMTEIFERKKSPFYHFGQLMRLDRIPYHDFSEYITERMAGVALNADGKLTADILDVTRCHPYYTQQLASQIWTLLKDGHPEKDVVTLALQELATVHDLDFERLWLTLNKTDRQVLQSLSRQEKIFEGRKMPASTAFSSIKKLIKKGYVIKMSDYEIEDPVFRFWIQKG